MRAVNGALCVLWVVTLTGASALTWWMSLGMFVVPWALARTTRLRPGESPMKLVEISPYMTPTLKYVTGGYVLATVGRAPPVHGGGPADDISVVLPELGVTVLPDEGVNAHVSGTDHGEMAAPPGFEPGMEVLQISQRSLS